LPESPLPARPAEPDDAQWAQVRTWRVQMRQYLIGERLRRAQPERAAQAERIKARLRELVDLAAHATIGIYWPVRGEVDLRDLALEHLRRGGRIGLPVVVQPAAPVEFWSWTEDAPMRPGVWNIPIPAERVVLAPELLLVPLVGFDRSNYRLGYGGGYYDRTLAACISRPRCIGLGYEAARLASIYPQPHDIPMHDIVTETRGGRGAS
jgi:5-formyltetrahydrofolate cyclo-ligase